jgi:hypothetical protein
MKLGRTVYQAVGILGVVSCVALYLHGTTLNREELLSNSSVEAQIHSLRNDIEQVKALRKQAASLDSVSNNTMPFTHSFVSVHYFTEENICTVYDILIKAKRVFQEGFYTQCSTHIHTCAHPLLKGRACLFRVTQQVQ